VWLKEGVFGIIELNTPLLLYRWLKVIRNDVRNVGDIPLRKMDSCGEDKDINARIVGMSFRIRLVPIKKRFKYKISNSGRIILLTNKRIRNWVKHTLWAWEQYRRDLMSMFPLYHSLLQQISFSL
jgi:hypothetical protein